MAVCNLIKELTKTTGNFVVFSQYTDDITRFAMEHDAYVVEPSSFAVLDIDYKKILTNGNPNYRLNESDPNRRIPELLQKYFENGCAYLKNNLSKTLNEGGLNTEWVPTISSGLLWRVLFESGLIELTYDNGDVYIPQMKYRGNIDIQSYNSHEGMGYGELYCYIPNNAPLMRYYYQRGTDDKSLLDQNDFLEGWSDSKSKWGENPGLVDGNIQGEGITYIYSSLIESLHTSHEETVQPISYKFNTVVVMYDIVRYDNQGNRGVVYRDIPYGIYFTGLCDDLGEMGNSVTKFISNDDTFGEGTSYGLRICTKFVVLPDGGLRVNNISTSTENYSAFAQAMSKMAESQKKMDDILSNINEYMLSIKSQLAEFKNYRVNIPYVRTINNESYWFVNGRNTGVKTSDHGLKHGYGDSTDDGIDQAFLTQKLQDIENIINKPSLMFTSNQYVFPKGQGQKVHPVLSWSIKKGDEEAIQTDLAYIKLAMKKSTDGDDSWYVIEFDDLNTRSYILTLEPDINMNYKLLVGMGSGKLVKELSSSLTISFESVSFYGHCETPSSQETVTVNFPDLNSVFKAGKGTFDGLVAVHDSIQIAYPKSFGIATKILDPVNNIDYTTDFYQTESSYEGTDYYVYTARYAVRANNMTLKFS